MSPQQHGNKVKTIVLLTPDERARLEAMAARERRSVSEMAAVIIDKAARDNSDDEITAQADAAYEWAKKRVMPTMTSDELKNLIRIDGQTIYKFGAKDEEYRLIGLAVRLGYGVISGAVDFEKVFQLTPAGHKAIGEAK